jgi:hypothetical protein
MGQPLQQGAQHAGQAADDQIMAMKQAALRQLAGNPAPPQPQAPAPQPQLPISEVQPNAASMSAPEAQSRMGAMIQAPEAMEQAAAKLRMQAQQDAAAEEHANHLGEEDMSGYSDVPKSRFGGLKSKLADDEDDERKGQLERSGTAEGSYGS